MNEYIKKLVHTNLEDITFSVVDVETTGMYAEFNRIMDIGIVQIKGLKVVKKWEALIDPTQNIPYWITHYTKLRDNDVIGKPQFEYYSNHIFNMLTDTVFVGHNAQFDYSFLKYEFKRTRYTFDIPKVCTVKLASRLVPQLRKHNLDILSKYYDIHISKRHRALPDAEATAIVLLKFIQMSKERFNANTFFDLDKIQGKKVTKDNLKYYSSEYLDLFS